MTAIIFFRDSETTKQNIKVCLGRNLEREAVRKIAN